MASPPSPTRVAMRSFLGLLSLMAALSLSQACLLHRKKPPQPAPAPAPAQAPAPPPPPVERWEAVSPEARLYYDDVGAFTDSVRLIVDDPDTWKDVWRRATSRQASTPPTPQVDFGRQVVLVVAAGRMKTGDEIHVDSVGTLEGRVRAVVRTRAQCGAYPATAYPFEIVRIPKSTMPVQFLERRDKAEDCG
jgi:hypothetical protein